MWMQCRYKALLYLMGVRPRVERQALQVGGLTHSLIEHDLDVEAVLDELRAVNADITSESFHSNLAFAHALAEAHNQYWGKLKDKKVWVTHEPTFSVDWEGFHLRGKIDGVFRVKKGGPLQILEIKTSSGFTISGLQKTLLMDGQIRYYMLAAEALYGEKITGAVYDVIRKPQHRLKAGEKVEDFRKRVRDIILNSPQDYLQRFEVPNGDRRMAEFRESLDMRLLEFEKWFIGESPNYRCETSCSNWGGCEYLQACGSRDLNQYTLDGVLFEELQNAKAKTQTKTKKRVISPRRRKDT